MTRYALIRSLLGAVAIVTFAAAAHAQTPAAGADAQVVTGEWTKICDPEGPNRMCMTTLDTYIKLKNVEKPIWLASAAVRDRPAQKSKTVLFRVPLHVRLKEGMLIRIDDGAVSKVEYEFCQAYGCEVVIPANDELIAKFKKGSKVVIQFTDVRGQTHQVEVTLAGFTAAVDGPPDKVLEASAVSAPTGGGNAATASGKGDAPAQ